MEEVGAANIREDGKTVRARSTVKPKGAWLWARLNNLLPIHTAMFLNSLHQIPEEELEESNILPDHTSPLTQLHNSDKCMQVSNTLGTFLNALSRSECYCAIGLFHYAYTPH